MYLSASRMEMIGNENIRKKGEGRKVTKRLGK